MSAPADVLAVMDRLYDWLPNLDHPDNSELPIHRDAREARAAVAELVEADKEYDAARRAFEDLVFGGSVDERRATHTIYEEAVARRAAALARVGGAS